MNHTQLQAMRWMAGTMKKEDRMSGPEFFQTGYGRRFFDGQLPQLISALERLGNSTARLVDIIDNEIKLTSVTVDGEKMSEYIEREALRILNKALDKVD